MCPEEERERRSHEYGALHDLERNDPDIPAFASLQQTMIKRFQKSAADHELNVPELVRTPRLDSDVILCTRDKSSICFFNRALLATIIYMEDNFMHLFENYDPLESSPIVVRDCFIFEYLIILAQMYFHVRSIYSFGIDSG